MAPGARQRLLGAAFSYIVGIGTRVVVQLATLPILFASWSAERVGLWMILFAVPSYFAVTGQAFSGAGGTAALAAARDGRWSDARAFFRASWLFGAGLAIATVAILVAGSALVPDARARDIGFVDSGELVGSIAWLGLYILALCQAALMLIPLRISGRYPLSNMALNIASLSEIAVLAVCVTMSDSLVLLAAALAGVRLATAAVVTVLAWKFTPRLFAASTQSARIGLTTIVYPSLAFMLLPVVNALNLQGYTLVVGFFIGVEVVAGFVALRVIVRAIDLVTSVVFAIQFFEAGYLGDDKQAIQRRQLATMTVITLACLAMFSIALFGLGDWLMNLFTAGKSRFDPALAAIFLAAGSCRALATTPQSMVAAANAHGPLARLYLIASAAALALAAAAAALGAPLLAIAGILVPVEAAVAIYAFHTVLRQLDWRPHDFASALASRERWHDILLTMRFLGLRG